LNLYRVQTLISCTSSMAGWAGPTSLLSLRCVWFHAIDFPLDHSVNVAPSAHLPSRLRRSVSYFFFFFFLLLLLLLVVVVVLASAQQNDSHHCDAPVLKPRRLTVRSRSSDAAVVQDSMFTSQLQFGKLLRDCRTPADELRTAAAAAVAITTEQGWVMRRVDGWNQINRPISPPHFTDNRFLFGYREQSICGNLSRWPITSSASKHFYALFAIKCSIVPTTYKISGGKTTPRRLAEWLARCRLRPIHSECDWPWKTLRHKHFNQRRLNNVSKLQLTQSRHDGIRTLRWQLQ